MAHELLIDGGRAAMFYVDEVPWHELGTRLKAPPTSREAIQAAGLDWTVAKAPLHVVGQYRLHVVPDRSALLRQDKLGQPDCRVFGIAGREYRVLQNRDAFAFFDPLVEQGAAAYETAGALGHGERVWVLARLKRDLEVAGDTIQRFLLLSNSHDGTSSVQVKLTPVRVVCQNTLTLALSRGHVIRIRHNDDMPGRLKNAKTLLGLVDERYEELDRLFQRLAATELKRRQALQYFAGVFPDGTTADATKRAVENRRWALHFYDEGAGNEARQVRQTLWAAYNGVTELVDHRRPRNQAEDFSSKRLRSVWYGSGAATKERALRLAAELVDAQAGETARSRSFLGRLFRS